jgi:hypothetical protein
MAYVDAASATHPIFRAVFNFSSTLGDQLFQAGFVVSNILIAPRH